MPGVLTTIPSPLHPWDPTNIGLHRCPPTYPPRNALRRFAFARNSCSPKASSGHPLSGPDRLAVLRTAWCSMPMPLLPRLRIPFVRAPGQDLRRKALTSDLLAMSVTRVAAALQPSPWAVLSRAFSASDTRLVFKDQGLTPPFQHQAHSGCSQ